MRHILILVNERGTEESGKARSVDAYTSICNTTFQTHLHQWMHSCPVNAGPLTHNAMGSQNNTFMRESQFISAETHAKMLLPLLTWASPFTTLCIYSIELVLLTGPAIGTMHNGHKKEDMDSCPCMS